MTKNRRSSTSSSKLPAAKRLRATPDMALTIPAKIDDRSVQFVVDNSYKRIPLRESNLDRSGNHHKIHDWTLYLDIVKGDPDLIERVAFDLGSTFEPREFISSSPIRVTKPNGASAWRFSTRQQVYGATKATISIRGAGGSKMVLTHMIQLEQGGKKNVLHAFREHRGVVPLRMLKIDDAQKFGIELELSSASLDPSMIADMMPRNAGRIEVMDTWREGRQNYTQGWKIVPDGSIACNRSMPNCKKFEVVSRILKGGNGLNEITAVTKALANAQIQVNKSMGFHVHVDVSEYSIGELIKICQNFIKYEDVMDSFMPPSRRNGSQECNKYFRSNRLSVQPKGATNKQRHVALANCYDIETLAGMMNRHGRFHKLNLQNLVTGRQPTLEFRQHSSTLSYSKISAWVRFCITFIQTSARLESPTPFNKGRDLAFQFNALFQFVVKDRALRDFYQARQEHVDDHCCSGCGSGGSCSGPNTGFAALEYM